MGLLRLPALMRAVHVRLLQRPPRAGARRAGHVAPGTTLLELISELSPELRKTALTHSSWVENRSESNERLEFLGDSVLGLTMASTLHRRYPQGEEGELARLKAFVVSRASCAQVAERLDVSGLMTQDGAAGDPRRAAALCNRTILGNALEALIGAVFLTFGFEQTRLAVVGCFEEQIVYAVTSYVDHKTALQERLALRGGHPVYKLVEESGPPHARVFTSEVNARGSVRGRGSGTTIKASEQAAAKEALACLDGAGLEG
jgi:ribonuclease-3